jgi:CheY-like chemotaxis protein
MNGFDLLHEVRQRPHFSRLPVFVWTNVRLSLDELNALSISAQAVVGKLDHGLEVLTQQLRTWQTQRAQAEAG